MPLRCVVRQVAEHGLKFVRLFGNVLGQRQANGALPPLTRETWAFVAALSVAHTASTLHAQRRLEQGRAASRRAQTQQRQPQWLCLHVGARGT